MKYRLLLLAVMLCSAFAFGQKVRVSCVGNSITYGAGIAAREQNSYPAQLQYYLGEDYEVRNFGVSGRTLLQRGDYPYVQTGAYVRSLDFRPDIVLIKLGTNDSKPQNWCHKENFEADYQALIDAYRNLPCRPRVILLSPVRCFLPEGSEINAGIIAQEVHPAVERLAYRNGLELIDLSRIFGNSWEQHIMPDRLHPSSIGAGIMAQAIGDYLLRTAADARTVSPLPAPAAASGRFCFHGYEGYDFTVDGVSCRLVKPRVEAAGRPWVLRARFWGHEPQTDIALLEQGFHIAYCDVADLYGSSRAVKRWNAFYRYMTKSGFAPKVVLEGMSRGGMIVYNWAAANPRKVACIYADAPVMDYRSWPLGCAADSLSRGQRSDDDVRRLLSAYGFADEAAALRAARSSGGPARYADVLARAGVPVLHVVGDADEVVPVDGNTAPFEARMKQLGASVQVIHKPACGHHPHSLFNPAPIVRFVLEATDRARNVCTHPVPGNGYRQGAGWTPGNEWHSVAADIRTALAGRRPRLLLLGNSITQGWGGTRAAVAYKPGKAAMDEVCGEGGWESAGISGDRTQNLLWRIQNHGYGQCRPGNVVIAIGVNNLLAGDSPADVAEGIEAVARAAEQRFTDAHIILLGLFPAGREKGDALRVKYDAVQALLAKRRFERAVYVDPTDWFVDEAGTIRDGLYTADYIHLSAEGYRVAAACLAPLLR